MEAGLGNEEDVADEVLEDCEVEVEAFDALG